MRSKIVAAAFAALLAVSCSSGGDGGASENNDIKGGIGTGAIDMIPGGSDVVSGKGSGEVAIDRLGSDGPVLVRATCQCQEMSTFSMTAAGEEHPLIDALGPFDGITMVTSSEAKTVSINTLDKWSIQFIPASEAKPYTGVRLEGAGTTVLANKSPGGPTRVTFSPDPDDSFASTSTFVVAEAEGVSFRNQGPSVANLNLSTDQGNLILVSGDGPWTIERAKTPTVELPNR